MKVPYLAKIRRIYLYLLVIYAVLREVIVLQNFVGSTIVTYGFFGIGVVLIGLDAISERSFLRARHIGWLAAFLGISVLSALLNYRYGMMDNIKTLGWMLLFFLLVYPTGTYEDPKLVRGFFLAFSLTMTAAVALSVPMYIYDVGYTYYKTNGAFTDQGFSFLYARLWGVFQEANYAAVYAELACFMSVYLAVKSKKKWAAILVTLQILLLMSFVVLSGSRTAKLVLVIAAAWMTFYAAQRLLSGKGFKKFIMSAGAAVLAVVAVLVLLQGLLTGLPYAKVALRTGLTDRQVLSAHTFYDRVYSLGKVNVVESSSERLFAYLDQIATEPTEPAETTEPSAATEPPDVTEPTPTLPRPVVQPINRTDLDSPDVSNGRLKRWKEGLDVFLKSPIIGASPRGTFALADEFFPESDMSKYRYSISNSYLEVLAGTGLLGAVAVFGFLLLTALNVVGKALREDFSAEHMLLHGIILTVILSAVLESDLFFMMTASSVSCWLVFGMLNGSSDKKPDLTKIKKMLCRREKK